MPTPVIDLLDWFIMPLSNMGFTNNGSVYGRDTHHLEGMNVTANSPVFAYHYKDPSKIVIMKGPKGYPWDIKTYDNFMVYDYQTEYKLNDPTSYKRFISPEPGVPICNRFMTGGTIITPKSGYVLTVSSGKCAPVALPGIGQIAYSTSYPFTYNYGGMIGAQPTVLISYFWNGLLQVDGSYLYTDREELYLTPTYGWLDWTHAKYYKGNYLVDAFVTHNQLVAGGAPTPVLPCP